MHFIDEHRFCVGIVGLAAFHPLLIAPRIFQLRQLRRRVGSYFGLKGVRVGFEDGVAVCRFDSVLVNISFLETFNVGNPNAVAKLGLRHRIGRRIPVIEFADNANLARMRSPEGKAHAGFSFI